MFQEQDKQNLFSYHEVFAKSIAVLHDLIRQGRVSDAKKIMIFNFFYAASINGKVYSRQLEDELNKKDIYELLSLMVQEQKKADLVPTQQHNAVSFYTRIVSKFKD